jgi:C4-dicarboxylate-specific signal transduction histidine kinase
MGPGAGPRKRSRVLPTDKKVGLARVLETAMNLTDVRANENCDGDASRIATVAELSARFAHELNEPLMCVLANAQAAERWLAGDPPNLEETNASIKRILRDARAVNETMQHIRALFNRESFDYREASIPDMMGEAVRLVQEDPNKREVPIDWCFDEHLLKVSVDPIQIQRVFVNLISNAIEAMEGSRIPPLVRIRATITDQDEMIIQVIDNGPGVDDAEKIFDAFVTTRKKGLGIGLAVSRFIIEAHGGRLWAENNPDGGATFSVAFPLSSVSRNPVGGQVSTIESAANRALGKANWKAERSSWSEHSTTNSVSLKALLALDGGLSLVC